MNNSEIDEGHRGPEYQVEERSRWAAILSWVAPKVQKEKK